ncbi:hypothetical protein F52700_4535 [Fusarium sp. NRRL 52700]|nr:hypothetical protein F52700_4535 [Fusarium sp. NRRL 52700]
MHFLSKPILALGLVGSLASASSILPTPSLTTSVISGTSATPLATGQGAPNTTQIISHLDTHLNTKGLLHGKDYVGHSYDEGVLARQYKLAMKLVPTSWYCYDRKTCMKMGNGVKYLAPEAAEAVQSVTVSMEQVDDDTLTIEVKITNEGTGPITFWEEYSPMSSSALDLGYFQFETRTKGIDFGRRTVDPPYGYRPDTYSDLVELGAGESVSARVKLPKDSDDPKRKSWLKMLEQAGDVIVNMSGSWYGIWAGTKNEVMATDMDVQRGISFWRSIYIPWEATYPMESEKCNEDCGMSLDFD